MSDVAELKLQLGQIATMLRRNLDHQERKLIKAQIAVDDSTQIYVPAWPFNLSRGQIKKWVATLDAAGKRLT